VKLLNEDRYASAASEPRKRAGAGTSPMHCSFITNLTYGSDMNRLTISAVYYYPNEVGIG
jgi:hypothetical protein